MTSFLKEFKFEKPPHTITYFDKEPLKLTNEFIFFHNKSKFRKELNPLQFLFKSYTNAPLHAAGIRDSYLMERFSEKFLITIFTTPETIKNANEIIENHSGKELNKGCFYLEVDTKYILLLSKDMEGLALGVKAMELILKQILEDYMDQKKFDEYIKVRTCEVIDCRQST